MALPNIWYGTQMWISLQRRAGSAQTPLNKSAEVMSFDISGGDRDTEDIYTFGNTIITKQLRADQLEVSFTALTTDTKWRYMWAGGTEDTTETTTGGILVSGLASTRDEWRIVLLLKDGLTSSTFTDTTNDYGRGLVVGPALRYTFTDAYSVSVNESLEADGNLEVDVSFKCAAHQLAIESVSSASANLSALATYTE
jgi:hypothetical protein